MHLSHLLLYPKVPNSPPLPSPSMHISHLFGDVVQSLLDSCLGICQVLFDQNWSNQFVHHSIFLKQIQLLHGERVGGPTQ